MMIMTLVGVGERGLLKYRLTTVCSKKKTKTGLNFTAPVFLQYVIFSLIGQKVRLPASSPLFSKGFSFRVVKRRDCLAKS